MSRPLYLLEKNLTKLFIYCIYLFLVYETVVYSCLAQLYYLSDKTPPSIGQILARVVKCTSSVGPSEDHPTSVNKCLVFGLATLAIFVLLHLRFYKRKQVTIKSYRSKRYLMAAAVICLNMLLLAHSMIILYSGTARDIIYFVFFSILFYCIYSAFDLLYESCSPIYYTLTQTTKVTKTQKIFMVLYFGISGAFYLGLSFIELDHLTSKNVALTVYYTTRFICPFINILAIPIVYVALLTYSSEEFAFSGVEPESGRFWSGVCRWNEKLGEWDHVEALSQKPDSTPLEF